MDIVFGFSTELLAAMSDQLAQSPEDFTIYLEEALEAGELTIDEVAQLIRDFNNPKGVTAMS